VTAHLAAKNDLKLMLSKGYPLGAWSPAERAHPYAGQDKAALRNWLVGESVYPNIANAVSTDGSTTTTSRTINIGSPSDGDYSFIIHRTAAAATITPPTGWSSDENRSVQGSDNVWFGSKLCDGTEGATATVGHSVAVRSITLAYVFRGCNQPVYSLYYRDIPLVGSESPSVDPLLGGTQPGVRRLFMVVCTKPEDGEVVSYPGSPWIDGHDVFSTGAGGSGASRIITAYLWRVANIVGAVGGRSVTFPMADVGAGGTNSFSFGIVISPK